jgi:hypothetical protein
MKLFHVRTKKTMTIHNPLLFLAQERELAEEAWAGDILGLPNHGNLRIGDALTEGEELRFTGIPSFAPELLRKVRPEDPMRAKHLGRAWAPTGSWESPEPSSSTSWPTASAPNTTSPSTSKEPPSTPPAGSTPTITGS